MLRTGRSPPLPNEGRDTALTTRISPSRRGPRYQGPWHLPGPDFQRLADLSFSLGLYLSHHLTSTLQAPEQPGRT